MQGTTHVKLGKMLAEIYGIHGLGMAAFLFGNIEPDLALSSRFTRNFERKSERFEGHRFDAASVRLYRLCAGLSAGEYGAKDYFLLGKACHYAADCFTWAHNSGYPGTLSAHISYEHQLDREFNALTFRSSLFPGYVSSGKEAFDEVMSLHRQYISVSPSIKRDIEYVSAAAYFLVGVFVGEYIAAPCTASEPSLIGRAV